MPYANYFDVEVPNAPRDLREVEQMLALIKKGTSRSVQGNQF